MVLGYGYWHSSTHGSAYIDLTMKSSNGTGKEDLANAEILFLDSDDNFLAKGIRDEKHTFVHLIHPTVGNCQEVAKTPSSVESRQLWQECFAKQSVWIPKWINNVSQVQIKHKNCLSGKIPAVPSKHNSEWLLWWIPLPHVGGKPYSFFRLNIIIEDTDCKI